MGISEASTILNIKYTTAKSLIQTMKKNGKITRFFKEKPIKFFKIFKECKLGKLCQKAHTKPNKILLKKIKNSNNQFIYDFKKKEDKSSIKNALPFICKEGQNDLFSNKKTNQQAYFENITNYFAQEKNDIFSLSFPINNNSSKTTGNSNLQFSQETNDFNFGTINYANKDFDKLACFIQNITENATENRRENVNFYHETNNYNNIMNSLIEYFKYKLLLNQLKVELIKNNAIIQNILCCFSEII